MKLITDVIKNGTKNHEKSTPNRSKIDSKIASKTISKNNILVSCFKMGNNTISKGIANLTENKW